METRDVFEVAKVLAKLWHKGQKYGEHDYFEYHLMGVVNLAAQKWGWHNKALLAVLVLHDILEDTDLTFEALVEAVGKDIATYVKGLTKIEGEDYLVYIARCREHHYTKEAKIFDTLFNLTQSIMADSKKRVKKYGRQLELLATD